MALRDSPQFEENLEKLQYLLDQREEVRHEIDQHYLTIDSIIDRLEVLHSSGMLEGKRVLTIGDADLTGLAIAIFGNPTEVVVADIDDRLSELYFEATMEYDLPVRFVYHDMRIKMIAILKKQYTLVLTEPPATKGGIKLFLSRALEILEPGENNRLFFSIPNHPELRSVFDEEIKAYNIEIIAEHSGTNRFDDNYGPTDFLELNVPDEVEPRMKEHYIHPLYVNEVNEEVKNYMCACSTIIPVGEGQIFSSVGELETKGCPKCNATDIFAYQSKIELK